MEKAQQVLKKYYGYNEFRPGQARVIASLLQERDTVAIMPTGAGKSICFQIPAMLLPGLTIVVSPLISLMKDQVDGLISQGLPATYINSSLSNTEMNERISQLRDNQFKLLYIAPERLDAEWFKTVLGNLTISMIAVDEAHCVSQWGHDFRPSYQGLQAFIGSLPKRPIIGAFTATATPEVKDDMITLLSLQQPAVHVTGFDRPNLFFQVLRGEDRQKFIINYVKINGKQSGIIYAATRKEVDSLYKLLLRQGVLAGRYHAGLSDQERASQQEKFLYDDIRVMVATNAFGMGIDKSNVRYVIHYNMPKNMEAYYQEAGRGGRDGEPSDCILLFSAQDILLQKFLIEKSVMDPKRNNHELKKLQDMIDYCNTPECLRYYILRYFGETTEAEECGQCGNCNDDSEKVDITIDAQKVLSCIYRMQERFGVTMVAEVLKGSNNQKVRQFSFQSLSTYGLFAERSINEIKTLIQRLVATQYLQLEGGQYPVVKLAPKAIPVLKGQAQVWQKVLVERKKETDDTLFEVLRRLRKQLADGEKVPPYVIFSDATLKEMSQYYPCDEEAMRNIKGIGEVKLQKYGQPFIEVITQYVAEHPTDKSVAVPQKHAVRKENEPPSHLITLSMFQQGRSLPEIAASRGLTSTTVQNHLVRCAAEGHSVNWDAIIPPEYEELVLSKIKELGTETLKPIKEALPKEVDYSVIKAVMCKHFS